MCFVKAKLNIKFIYVSSEITVREKNKGEAMATVLITYDVSAKQVQVKASLTSAPYSYYDDAAKVGDNLFNLPNTTLWKPDTTAAQAKLDMENVAKSHQVKLERAVAVEFSKMDGIKGDPHS